MKASTTPGKKSPEKPIKSKSISEGHKIYLNQGSMYLSEIIHKDNQQK